MTVKTDLQAEKTGLSASDIESIERTCLDYLDGWYTADAKRIAQALHPELVKRSIMRDPEQGWILRNASTYEQMVELTRRGGGSKLLEGKRVYDITIQHGFRHIVAVSALSPKFMDYLHLTKLGDRWVIVNVLWELREGILED